MGNDNTDAQTPGEVFRHRLREARDRQGLSTRELADRLADLSVTMDRAAISRIESGPPPKGRNVTIDEMFALAWALNVTPAWLLTPYEMDAPMRLAGDNVRPAWRVREWLGGRVDRFHGNATPAQAATMWTERPEEEVLADQRPGLRFLRDSVAAIVRAAATDDGVSLERSLRNVQDEMERQRAIREDQGF